MKKETVFLVTMMVTISLNGCWASGSNEEEVEITSTPIVMPIDAQGNLVANSSMRTGPGLSFEEVGELSAGDAVSIIGTSTDTEWYLILYTDAQGLSTRAWISAGAVQLEISSSDQPIEETRPALPIGTFSSTPTLMTIASLTPTGTGTPALIQVATSTVSKTSVPSLTKKPVQTNQLPTSTPAFPPVASPTNLPKVTQSPIPYTPTLTLVPIATPTSPPSVTATQPSTLVPIASPTDTRTGTPTLPPSQTPIPISTRTPTLIPIASPTDLPTSTQGPTSTPAPTSTPVPTNH